MSAPFIFANFPGGNFPAADWDTMWAFVGNLANIYCSCAGTANSITLTPAATSMAVTAYQTGQKFTFIAANTNTGAVSATVGSLAALALYDPFGNGISASGAIMAGTYYELVYESSLNSGAGGFVLLSPSQAAGSQVNYTMVTAAGSYTVLSTDFIILMNKTIGAATSILAPTSASRSRPIIVKDYKGDAATNNITFTPQSGETIDGFSAAAAASNGLAVVNSNYGWRRFFPLISGGWYNL